MFSVTYTGTCLWPLCTAIVMLTICGRIVDARDQVRITVFWLERAAASTIFSRLSWMNGPFFVDRGTLWPPGYFVRRRTMNLSVFLLLRVRSPIAGLPQGVFGPGRPIGDLPSPPPCGWSRGFIAEPRTVGR